MNTLIVITGPTGVGKTAAAIAVAQQLHCHIVNADSRQVYRDIPIGTAAPTASELAQVPHHLVGFKSLDEPYSASQFEHDVLQLLPQLWQDCDYAVMCGGSMMYVDAVCNGIDDLPDIAPALREAVLEQYHRQGLESVLADLERLDPDYYAQVDKKNPRRVIHAVEICRQAGVPYSSLRKGVKKLRPFRIVKLALNMDRPALFSRINRRVDAMMEAGLLDEARRVYPLRHLNALNTVGYKELFAHFDGFMPLDVARERIKKNTRVYAKKQLTWLARDPDVTWCQPHEILEHFH
ncbi:MAG: tRNA (adenosine(37)-N6)-dimethylallyltransferase MiaA [Muribaculaceae bacterium]|nr:tRNA (adenosine(37)-N6)-dimethylallyltransferase MiaA [Muribaculaceae bacterium]